MIVDTHLHIVGDDFQRYPIAPAGGNPDWALERPLSAEGLLRRMDQAGVDKASVVQPATVHGYDNSYICDSAQRYPDRIAAVCTVDMVANDAGDRLRYWIEERGAVGLRLTASASGGNEDWLTDRAAGPAWEAALAMDVPVAVHVRSPRGLGHVRIMLQRYPGLRFQLDHLGHPNLDGGPPYPDAEPLLELAMFPNLTLKVTEHALEALARNPAGPAPFLRLLIDTFGANRLMWGSNIPRFEDDYPKMVGLLRSAASTLPPADAAWLMGETALGVYPRLRS